MKKLPNVFVNPIDHKVNNAQDVYTSFYTQDRSVNKNITFKDIDDILNNKHHIYKSNVKITTDNESIVCKIVSRNNNYIITMDNKKIPISIIRNIEVI